MLRLSVAFDYLPGPRNGSLTACPHDPRTTTASRSHAILKSAIACSRLSANPRSWPGRFGTLLLPQKPRAALRHLWMQYDAADRLSTFVENLVIALQLVAADDGRFEEQRQLSFDAFGRQSLSFIASFKARRPWSVAVYSA